MLTSGKPWMLWFLSLCLVTRVAAWLSSRSQPGKRRLRLYSCSLSLSERCSPVFPPDVCWEFREELGLLLLCRDLCSLPSPQPRPPTHTPTSCSWFSARPPRHPSAADGSRLVSPAMLKRNLSQEKRDDECFM